MSATQYRYRLTEEICRWAFEVALQGRPNWFLAFTNPTAGPWKRLMAPDEGGAAGEVHRFEREETRPDLVLVNDALEVVVILEAKDDVAKLRAPDQVQKTAAMMTRMSALLATKADNPSWGRRAEYSVCAGLLWGATQPVGAAVREQLDALYRTALESAPVLAEGPALFVECVRDVDDSIVCVPHETHLRADDSDWAASLVESLGG